MKALRQVDLADLVRRIRAIEGQSLNAVHTAETLRIRRIEDSTGESASGEGARSSIAGAIGSCLPSPSNSVDPATTLSTGWPSIDAAAGGGLPRGALHEWFGVQTPDESSAAYKIATSTPSHRQPSRHEPWSPPLSVLAHLAWQAAGEADAPPWALWIGPQCFPYPHVLTRRRGADRRLLDRSIFVRAKNMTERLWATELALRCRAVGAVVVDASQFSMPATRRIQLLARGHGCVVLAARPPHERKELSAAHSRWRVQWAMSEGSFAMPRWRVELLRCKGTRIEEEMGWILEQDRATGAIGISAALADATGEKTPVARARANGT